jgi:lactate dehydrogenase-like 2-hydroxyacid dehydrogenase
MAEVRILYPDVLSTDDHAVERAAVPAGVAFDIHNERDPAAIPGEVWQGCHGMVTGIRMPVDKDVIQRLDSCRIITRLGVGYDLIDIAAAGARGIAVCNVPDYGTTEVADHAIALLLSFTRGVARYNEAFRADPEAGWDYQIPPTVKRHGELTFGVIGLGRIGTAAAMRAKAFGMTVIFFDPYVPDGQELALGIGRVRALADLLGQADLVTIHAPLTDDTRHLIDARAVAAMKPGLILANTARGPIIDLDAAYDGLKSGQLGALGLDVFDLEPPPADHPLIRAWRDGEDWVSGRFLVTPHAAFYSPTSVVDLRRKAVMTCVDFFTAGTLRNCVNRDLLKDVPR